MVKVVAFKVRLLLASTITFGVKAEPMETVDGVPELPIVTAPPCKLSVPLVVPVPRSEAKATPAELSTVIAPPAVVTFPVTEAWLVPVPMERCGVFRATATELLPVRLALLPKTR